MTVGELIEQLKNFDPDLEIKLKVDDLVIGDIGLHDSKTVLFETY